MKKTRSYRINENTHELIMTEAKSQRRSVGQTLDIIVESYFNKPKQESQNKAQKTEKEPDYIGYSDQFIDAWKKWADHKKSINSTYKSAHTQSIAIANLAKQCQGIESRMIEAIYHSIGNNYKGIYEKNGYTGAKTGTSLTDQFIQKITGTH